MRRSTTAFAAMAVLVATGTALLAVSLAPARHATPPILSHSATRASPAVPDPAAALAALAQSADLTAAFAPMPGATLLATSKESVLQYWNEPDGNVIQLSPPLPWGGPIVRPVLKARRGWLLVLLESRPNGSTGWVPLSEVTLTVTTYRIAVSVSQRTLAVYHDGQVIHSAPVGVGQPRWPTPTGLSFIDGFVPVPARQQSVYGSDLIMTATHSEVFNEFEGGDGRVGIHTYPSNPASTAGVASSHGCIRVDPNTLAAIEQVPPGTLLDINP